MTRAAAHSGFSAMIFFSSGVAVSMSALSAAFFAWPLSDVAAMLPIIRMQWMGSQSDSGIGTKAAAGFASSARSADWKPLLASLGPRKLTISDVSSGTSTRTPLRFASSTQNLLNSDAEIFPLWFASKVSKSVPISSSPMCMPMALAATANSSRSSSPLPSVSMRSKDAVKSPQVPCWNWSSAFCSSSTSSVVCAVDPAAPMAPARESHRGGPRRAEPRLQRFPWALGVSRGKRI